MAVVAVSRQLGTGADEICRLAAEETGYELVDKKLISDVAEAAQVAEADVRNYDEVDERGIRGFVRHIMFPEHMSTAAAFAPGPAPFVAVPVTTIEYPEPKLEHFLDRDEYQDQLRRLLESLARRGNVIVVGRASTLLLANRHDVVRVRFRASEQNRISLLVDAGRRYEDAREEVRRSDRQRSAYVHNAFHCDWDDPDLYDVIINTGAVNQQMAAEILVAAIRAREPGGR